MHPVDRIARLLLPAGIVAVCVTVLTVGWFTQPDRYAKGYAPRQPIAFSHMLHAGTMQIPCLYCHGGAEKSRTAGIPAVEICMNCHRVTNTDSPRILRLAEVYKTGQPLPWIRIHTLPDHVAFDHRPHVNGEIACQTCHGEVQTMEVVSRQMSMRMSNCLGCHRDPARALPRNSAIKTGAEYCSACHR